ncbi:STAS domain-containing protein [Dyadobacter fanqingshengii]|uniref:STAS domain-containing protein n=1 Tax=Dyadobacter fanqingshengii TaxID=2906443 RepID=A0A9X1PBC7_9BACT|nr:STAS domain-containing protein [Dyadobacter fanqingshengii]MCF0041846.1 STAS domain-containing protein [Dyadobacter fanqingshengii]MCF2504928.1 STAS domain-containing protein [Dyadobacter fanqingshengii]USJ36445.1 STAS domain-containing protein [Dyadobacter fanqingshengii]
MILKVNQINHVAQATILPQEASLANAEMFKEEMITLVANGARLIIVSFENVNYIDSSFLGSLVVALKYAMPRNVDIYLVSLKPDVRNLLTLIRMDKVFKMFKDFEEAMEASQ